MAGSDRSSSPAPARTTSRASTSSLPRDALVVVTGLSGLRQVEPRLRHDLRRGPAPLRRVAVGLRAPVPRPDGEARRRLDRGPLAGDLDRPEDDLAQPALDGRHGDRDLRLPAPALGADRQAALPQLRRADRRPVDRADHRPRDDARGGRRGSWSWRRSSAGARASTGSCSRRCARQGYARAVDRRRAAPPRRGDRARQEVQARHLDRRRPAGDEGGPAQAARRVARGGLAARRGPGRGRDPRSARRGDEGAAEGPGAKVLSGPSAGKRGEVLRLQREVRLPQLRHLDARARAADLLLQLAARLLPALPRARLPAGDRPGADRPRPDPLDLRGRARAVDEGGVDLPPAAARGGRRGERDRHRRALARPARTRTASCCSRAPATSATRSPTATASAAGASTRSASTACCTASSAATRTPTPRTPASGSRR